MATHLDLEEQEQLDALKHFWSRWGGLVTWLLIAAMGAYAAWNGWQYWQRRQAMQASAFYDAVDRAAQAGDVTRLEQALADIRARYPRTTYAAQANLLAAKVLAEKSKLAEAKAALAAAADKAPDEGIRGIARMRLASLLIGEKAYDEALKQLSGSFPAPLAPLAADRRGDVLLAQGKRSDAATEFGKAYQGLDVANADYRRLVATKLNALGIDADARARTGAAS